MPVEVGWIFSLIRSGSSIAAYAAAAPGAIPVADEVFGPWVRTGKVYRYPREQRLLVEAFKAADHRLTPDVVALANRLFDLLGAESGRVISKCPHLLFSPQEFSAAFPHHRAVYLLRNPLHRLNSHYVKGWEWMIEPDHDVRAYTEFVHRWLTAEHRVVYDDLRRDPHGFFRALYSAWGWEHTEAALADAAAYAAGRYHTSSKQTAPDKAPRHVDSERLRLLPRDAIDAYLRHPFLRDVMRERGWPTNAAAYRPGLLRRTLARIRRRQASRPPDGSPADARPDQYAREISAPG
jgi:hypothetical protein